MSMRDILKTIIRLLIKLDIHLWLLSERRKQRKGYFIETSLNYVEHVRQLTGAKYKGETYQFYDFLYKNGNMGVNKQGEIYYLPEND